MTVFRAVAVLALAAALISAGKGQAAGQASSKPVTSPTGGPPRDGPPRPEWKAWWQDAEILKELKLAEDKIQRIRGLWDEAMPRLKVLADEVDKQQREADRLMSARASIDVVMLQLDQVESQRTALNKLRSITFYKMHRILTPEQDQKLKDLTAARGRRGGGPPKW